MNKSRKQKSNLSINTEGRLVLKLIRKQVEVDGVSTSGFTLKKNK